MTVYVYDPSTDRLVDRDTLPRRERVPGPYVMGDVREHESPMGDGMVISSRSHQREVCKRHDLRLKDPSESKVGPVKKQSIAKKYGAKWVGDL